jgi:hypothetical protein
LANLYFSKNFLTLNDPVFCEQTSRDLLQWLRQAPTQQDQLDFLILFSLIARKILIIQENSYDLIGFFKEF